MDDLDRRIGNIEHSISISQSLVDEHARKAACHQEHLKWLKSELRKLKSQQKSQQRSKNARK